MANRRYKDTVFRDLFGSEMRKDYTLSLYNALAGTNYDDPSLLEVTTLDDVLYMNVKNDVSFIIDEEITLWEHQSTYNPNMPIRGLQYFSKLYQKYIRQRNMNMYGSKLLPLPTPRYVVFYNGTSNQPDRKVLRLSDSFTGNDPDVEVKAAMVNINSGRNRNLMSGCEALAGYSSLIARVRAKVQCGYQLAEAVSQSVDDCIDDGILREYLLSKKSEVIAMFMTEYDEDKVREMFRQDGREEGLAEGLAQGRAEGKAEGKAVGTLAAAAALVGKGLISVRDAADGLGIPEEDLLAAIG